ncbi:MAG: hypothetical protein VX265_16705 [Myxococcota bacterium]|nr:hypothetical protein [Myxococcota bacterium]
MRRSVCTILMLSMWGCARPGADEGTKSDADGGADDHSASDTGSADTGASVPDWVDPEVPSGPIPPPAGTSTTPEEEDFDWSTVGTDRIGNNLPEEDLDWDEHPRYGVAQVLDWSDSDACVCFDVGCATCSAEPCSAETCTYDLNESHTLTKYHVELRSTEHAPHAVTFEVNVSADPPIGYTDIEDVLARLERLPVQYWHGFQIITEFGHGIQFLHRSYFGGGAAAYGGMNYIDTQTADLPVLLHELGHTYEQYTRIGNAPALEPQANILDPIWRHAIRSDDNRTSNYGSLNEWEDMAEFARIHAQCLVEGSLDELEASSPERFRIWERILLNGTTIHW